MTQQEPVGDWPSWKRLNYDDFMSSRLSSGVIIITIVLGVSSAFTNIRIGSLQPADLVLLLLFGFSIAKFFCSGFSLRISEKLGSLFRSYILLFLVLVVLTALSLRLEFFPLEEASALKQPGIFSISKLLQFAAAVCAFFWLIRAVTARRRLLSSAMSAYWVTGVACSVYGILWYAVLRLTHPISSPNALVAAYSPDGITLRARGFFNEGGPFGMYLLSVFVVGILRRHVTGRKLGVAASSAVCVAFLLASSKAAFFTAAVLLLYSVMSAASLTRKVAYFSVSILILGSTAVWLNLGGSLLGYLDSFENAEQEIAAHAADNNLVAGRIAAFYIVPKMISAHPFTGIGFGNYPLMRNDPHYLGFLPDVRDIEDLTGLGLAGIAPEIGLPATLWLMILLFQPYWANRKGASIIAISLLFQPTAHVLGVQITFFYPWFVTACAIGAVQHSGYIESERRKALPPGLPKRVYPTTLSVASTPAAPAPWCAKRLAW